MPYRDAQYRGNKWMMEAYKQGYYAGQENRYDNPYKVGLFGGDLDRCEAYDQGYEDGKSDR
jgi:hypothetical protein